MKTIDTANMNFEDPTLEDVVAKNYKEDNWAHRSSGMVCDTCMYYVQKGISILGRCRRRAPTLDGWPVMFSTDWCGDHKLNEENF